MNREKWIRWAERLLRGGEALRDVIWAWAALLFGLDAIRVVYRLIHGHYRSAWHAVLAQTLIVAYFGAVIGMQVFLRYRRRHR